MIARRDEHFRRENAMNLNMLQAIKDRVQTKGIDPLSLPEMAVFESAVRDKAEREWAKGPTLWLILSVVTLGLAMWYVYSFLLVDFYHHEQREAQIVKEANAVLEKAGARSFIQYTPVLPERHFWLNVLVLIVTIGFWGIFWQYRVLSDPNRHFEMQWGFEDRLPSAIAAI